MKIDIEKANLVLNPAARQRIRIAAAMRAVMRLKTKDGDLLIPSHLKKKKSICPLCKKPTTDCHVGNFN